MHRVFASVFARTPPRFCQDFDRVRRWSLTMAPFQRLLANNRTPEGQNGASEGPKSSPKSTPGSSKSSQDRLFCPKSAVLRFFAIFWAQFDSPRAVERPQERPRGQSDGVGRCRMVVGGQSGGPPGGLYRSGTIELRQKIPRAEFSVFFCGLAIFCDFLGAVR